jgi:hypothetical protein
MPICKYCSRIGPSVDYHKSPTYGWLCIDKIMCKRRRKANREFAREMEREALKEAK